MYQKIVKPILFKMDPEFVHDRFVFAGKLMGSNPFTRGALRLNYRYEHQILEQDIHGIHFKNPIGLSAGFDKDCNLMHVMPAMGFGFEEVGSITAKPYKGNPGKRLVRLPKDDSIIVYYGLKNKGALTLRHKFLKKDGSKKEFDIPIGISVAKTNMELKTLDEKIADWVEGLTLMQQCGSYITINVSCPNTFDPQNFNDPCLLAPLLAGIEKAGLQFDKPVFLKLSADIGTAQFDEIVKVCDKHAFIKGFILTNLVKDRSKLQLKSDPDLLAKHKGGLSGKVVFPYALNLTKHAYQTAGDRYTIIGCGGIFTAEDAYAYIRSGASLLQMITGMIYGGPGTIKRINKGLVKLLEADGYKHIAEAIGADVRGGKKKHTAQGER